MKGALARSVAGEGGPSHFQVTSGGVQHNEEQIAPCVLLSFGGNKITPQSCVTSYAFNACSIGYFFSNLKLQCMGGDGVRGVEGGGSHRQKIKGFEKKGIE